MSSYQPKFTEQELAAEAYIKAFLSESGISPGKVPNMQKPFLLGIYNGLIIANNMMQMGNHVGVIKAIAVFKLHFDARERTMKEFNENQT